MSYLSRIEKAKKVLADIVNKPKNSFELKYNNLNSTQAWDLFFDLFIIRFKHMTKVQSEAPIQWKILSDIYNFIDDKVIKLSETALEFKLLMQKFGRDEYTKAFEKHHNEITTIIAEMVEGAHTCRQLAVRHQIAQHTLYQKYEVYLREMIALTPDKLFNDYFLKGNIPLDTFDANCVEKEGDPINNMIKRD